MTRMGWRTVYIYIEGLVYLFEEEKKKKNKFQNASRTSIQNNEHKATFWIKTQHSQPPDYEIIHCFFYPLPAPGKKPYFGHTGPQYSNEFQLTLEFLRWTGWLD